MVHSQMKQKYKFEYYPRFLIHYPELLKGWQLPVDEVVPVNKGGLLESLEHFLEIYEAGGVRMMAEGYQCKVS